jgi:hypothetical protein
MIDFFEALLASAFAGVVLLLMLERSEGVANWIAKTASQLVPRPNRYEKQEQWLADISAVNGDMWKIIAALGMCTFAISLRLRSCRRKLGHFETPRLRRVAVGFSRKRVYAFYFRQRGAMLIGVSQSCAYLTVWFPPSSNRVERAVLPRLIAFGEGFPMRDVTVRITEMPEDSNSKPKTDPE